ncbi:thioesterase family protein [Bradyrhizobium liaoningense]|uniref:acyl-CoA thioesterase n=1 Tax=Bradyrhizobium liaoningense TaxID=43992 RepID=UPI001BAC2952|nr:acyl-CoA thioesterase [Bradyrhizobium liaoningense]MBR1031476.1 acyl-CoA thioesterase [Bradyrhizobium liaoningense]
MNLNVAQIECFAAELRPRPAFIYRHIVSFEETNVVGNVYFTRHVSWQGRCREMFLKQNTPDILHELARDLRLVTLRVACDYFEELNALDEIELRMSLAHLRQHRIGLSFDIMKLLPGGANLAARGFQEIGCMRLREGTLAPVSPPASLARALKPFQPAAGSGFDGRQ